MQLFSYLPSFKVCNLYPQSHFYFQISVTDVLLIFLSLLADSQTYLTYCLLFRNLIIQYPSGSLESKQKVHTPIARRLLLTSWIVSDPHIPGSVFTQFGVFYLYRITLYTSFRPGPCPGANCDIWIITCKGRTLLSSVQFGGIAPIIAQVSPDSAFKNYFWGAWGNAEDAGHQSRICHA